ncbi:UPF0583 protein C15orf59 [Merluccius polli]|uniref:Inhibitory synaptic factor 1 n=1 Tax=Merluccius polli TaxID=89951 RepID=A0AA47M1H6_MERPO|nr:UPF0583 protein C15orf59 [Merluccius polli]
MQTRIQAVVGQIDKLTSDFDFDLEPDDWTVATASSTSSSERGLGEAFRLDLLNPDVLSDSWEFCSYLEATGAASGTLGLSGEPPGDARPELGRGTIPTQTQAPCTPPPPATATTASAYSQMNGGLPIPNGPRIITPDSSSEEASSSTHSHKTSRTSGTRERVRFSDKILYHALCCDDDEDDEEEEQARAEEEEEEEEEEEDKSGRGTPDSDIETSPLASAVAPKRSYSEHSLHCPNFLDPSYVPSPARGTTGAHTLPRKGLLNPGCRKKLLRNSSTQTVSDKSTQTVLPYIPTKQKTKDH